MFWRKRKKTSDNFQKEVNKIKDKLRELENKVDSNYTKLREDLTALDTNLSELERAIERRKTSYPSYYPVTVRLPRRTHDSAIDPPYEKDWDFGPRPVTKSNKG